MTVHADAPTDDSSVLSRLRFGPNAQVRVIAGALAAATILILVSLPDGGQAYRDAPDFFPLVVAGLFAFSLLAVFHVEFRREALTFSLSEVPIMLALVYISPVYGVLARLGGSLVWAMWRRVTPFKLVFNLSTFAFELAVAHAVMRAIVDVDDSSNTLLVIAALVAALTGSILGSFAIALAISRFEGGVLVRIVDEIRNSWILVVNAICGAVLLGLALISLSSAVLAVVPIGALWLVMRRHGELAQRLRDLDEVHGFAGRVGRSLDLDEIGHAAVAEVARLLRAKAAVLVLTSADGPNAMMVHGEVPAHVPSDPAHRYWRELALGEQGAQVIEGRPGRRNRPAVPETILAPVDDETGVIGILLVAGPDGVGQHFGVDDVDQVVNLAEQLAASLRKGMLHRQIEHEARHDGLTGLPNRNAFEYQVQSVAHRDDGRNTYLLMLDLDRFKEVNDTLGHHAGDDLLIQFSRRVTSRLGPDDFFARLAGDEFAIVAPRSTDDDAIELARSCIEEASRPVTLDGLSIVVTASVGIAELDPDEADEGRALRRADIAMYNAKSHHLGIEFFRAELDRRTPARLSMLGDLRDAIGQAQLHVEYQPKLDLASGLVTAAEALVRWNHPVRGAVPPHDFVRVAEETGLIKQLTDLMLSDGIAEVKRLHDRGHHLGLSVNLSTHDLLDAKLPARVAGYLDANDVPAHVLTLEITESSLLIDAPRTRTTIDELHEMGVRLSIDDFGTGYSSLSYLRQLPVRELKVDQSFVANVLIDSQDEVIVRSTIDLGHNLGLEVVAEGVENNEILERLREFGCDMAQGYCISRPLSASKLLAWLNVTSIPSLSHDPLDLAAWEATEAERWQRAEDRRTPGRR
ncbi:MAG: EAL domain-containing protein [Actinomycetota bacterium]